MKSTLFKKLLFAVLLFRAGLDCRALDLVAVANEGTPASSLSAAALKDILTGKTMYWEGGVAVVIVVLTEKSDACLEQASGLNASAFKTHWQRLTFSGRGKSPKSADSIEKVAELVAQTPGALAILPPGSQLKGVKTIQIK